MKISWITDCLGTAPYDAATNENNVTIIDVRDLVDKPGNTALLVLEKVEEGVSALQDGQRIVVCCDYGMSRSNAVAAGILANYKKDDFDKCLQLVMEKTNEKELKLGPVMAVRGALEFSLHRPRIDESRPNLLMTGGSGFIGQAFQAAATDEFVVWAPQQAELNLLEGSTKLALLVEKYGVDRIVHLANPRIYTSSMAMGQTLTMLRNVIDVCITMEIPLLYLSNWEVFSGYTGTLWVDEATPFLPKGPYGETKLLAELLIGHHVRTTGLRCTMLRSSPVYGKGSDRPKFIFNFFDKAARHAIIRTHRYSNGEPMLDLLHVDDLVTAIIAAIRSQYIGVLNIGTGNLTSTSDLARMLIQKLNSRSSIEQAIINDTTARIAMNWALAQKEIHWVPKIQLEDGIEDIFEYILG
ncbi:NAD-dependent epimerase/dehydratase family protein [Desulfobotulus sp. H1]|uniref:NAD-dependent epimerase/dehydratase family protein n=1 Tax=Desulfobotulus pelophilus TaxID=2823377 RepID=A0ABT3NDA2_9BACT|nr:NAD-dependent epimerase/dehydratase family protein [Desulfobotulus pelophilus]MCW7755400.1 NAD-dependent epimerase/dehydratase family protein [Desulfobotulus pelophilus]